MIREMKYISLYRCTGKILDELYTNICVGDKFTVLFLPHDEFVTMRDYHTDDCIDMPRQMLYDYFQKVKYYSHTSNE